MIATGSPGAFEAWHAYLAAVGEALGKPVAIPDQPFVRADLLAAINTHLRADGTATGAIAAMREAVSEWVEAYRDRPQLTSGWRPRKFLDWLNERDDVALPEPPPRDAAQPPAPAPSGPRMTDEQRAENRRRIAELELGDRFLR